MTGRIPVVEHVGRNDRLHIADCPVTVTLTSAAERKRTSRRRVTVTGMTSRDRFALPAVNSIRVAITISVSDRRSVEPVADVHLTGTGNIGRLLGSYCKSGLAATNTSHENLLHRSVS